MPKDLKLAFLIRWFLNDWGGVVSWPGTGLRFGLSGGGCSTALNSFCKISANAVPNSPNLESQHRI